MRKKNNKKRFKISGEFHWVHLIILFVLGFIFIRQTRLTMGDPAINIDQQLGSDQITSDEMNGEVDYSTDGEVIFEDDNNDNQNDNGVLLGNTDVIHHTVYEQMSGFNRNDIHICNLSDNKCIIIMDRNLGASEAGIETNSYGYYYQWGNNYGFTPAKASWNWSNYLNYSSDEFTHNGFYESSFFFNTGGRSFMPRTNLRGGENDTQLMKLWDINIVTGRQGPCPEGYHIPSAGERRLLYQYRYVNEYGEEIISYEINDFIVYEQFLEDFKIPFAGFINWNKSAMDVGSVGKYWTSTANPGAKAFSVIFSGGVGYFGQSDESANAYPLRCFKDAYNFFENFILSFDSNGGTIIEDQLVIENERGKNPKNPQKSGYIFEGWYSDSELTQKYDFDMQITGDIKLYAKWKNLWTLSFETNGGTQIETQLVEDHGIGEEPNNPEKSGEKFVGWYIDEQLIQYFDFENTPITGDIVLHAKREACPDGYVVKNNVCVSGNVGISYDDGNIEYIDTNGKVFTGIGTIKFYDGEKTIIMLDRNLGAVEYIDTDNNNDNDMLLRSPGLGTDNLGYYFQWGNNYGFMTSGITTGEEQKDTTGYGWNNPYVSDIFIVGNENRSISNNNSVLWGGEFDVRDNIWDTSEFQDYMRQGPCPAGYHVPSGGEWISLFTAWAESKGYTLSVSDKLALDTKTHPEYIEFLEEFKIPYAGRLDYIDASYNNHDNKFVYLRSSSPYEENSPYSRRLLAGPRAKSTSQRMRANGYPIRCFADNNYENEVYILKYNTRGGTPIQSQTIASGENGYLPGYTSQKSGVEIIGWYDKHFQELEMNGNIFPTLIINGEIADSDKNINIQIRWSDEYLVQFIDYDGRILKQEFIKNGDKIIAPLNPERQGYDFAGRDKEYGVAVSDMIIKAKYTEKKISVGGGGGGSSLKKDNCPNGDYSDSYYDGTCGKQKITEDSSAEPQNNKTGHNSANEVVYDTLKFNPHYSDEMNQAYQFAYHYGITTKTNIKDAAMNWELTRIAMAKMLSQYAINVLGIQPDKNRNNQFADVSDKLDTEYNDGVTLAYQLGIMGINMPNNEFKPYNYVTRAEFATALSRLLYHTSDGMFEKTSRYYVPHINKLAYEGILTNTDPTMKELRGYVMLMLMRSAK